MTKFHGEISRRGEGGYEEARRAAVWNARTPHRFPDLIVQAESDDDVAQAVRLARDEGMKIGVRSGGHSWAGNHVRDGGMLLDVSRLDRRRSTPTRGRRRVAPGCRGDELAGGAGASRSSSSPLGTARASRVGGYLLQGGFGWNGRVHGPACMSVEAIDVVTADGELVHADETSMPTSSGRHAAPARASSASSPASTCASTRSPKHDRQRRLPLPDRAASRRSSAGRTRSDRGCRGRWS